MRASVQPVLATSSMQDHVAAGQLDRGQDDRDFPVAGSRLRGDGGVATGGSGDGLHPWARFAVGAEQQRRLQPGGEEARDQRRRRQRDGAGRGHRVAQVGDPMQVRIHGDDRVEALGEQPADDALADRLARREGHVLAHVAEVGRDQRHPRGAELARGGGGEQQLDQLGVGMIEAAADRDVGRHVGRQREPGLAVGEAVHVDDPARPIRRGRERARLRRVVGKAQDHGNSARAHRLFPAPAGETPTLVCRDRIPPV